LPLAVMSFLKRTDKYFETTDDYNQEIYLSHEQWAINDLQETSLKQGTAIKILQKTGIEQSIAIKNLQRSITEQSSSIKNLQEVILELKTTLTNISG